MAIQQHENPGNFRNNRQRAADAGSVGCKISPGNFKFRSRQDAVDAGRKGGRAPLKKPTGRARP